MARKSPHQYWTLIRSDLKKSLSHQVIRLTLKSLGQSKSIALGENNFVLELFFLKKFLGVNPTGFSWANSNKFN